MGASYVRQKSIQREMVRYIAARIRRGSFGPVRLDEIYAEIRHKVRPRGAMATYDLDPRAAYFAAYNVCIRFNREARRHGIRAQLKILNRDQGSVLCFAFG